MKNNYRREKEIKKEQEPLNLVGGRREVRTRKGKHISLAAEDKERLRKKNQNRSATVLLNGK